MKKKVGAEDHRIQSYLVPCKLETLVFQNKGKDYCDLVIGQLGDYFCKTEHESEANIYCWFSHCQNVLTLRSGQTSEAGNLLFTRVCKVVLLSPSTGLYWFEDFRDQ